MNISVEYYEEMYLKDKDEKSVLSEVQNIRQQIERAKFHMESPLYSDESRLFSSMALDIEMYRRYLECAYARLAELRPNESYLSEEEKVAMLFDAECDNIKSVTLNVGRHLDSKHELVLSATSATLMRVCLESDAEYYDLDRNEVMQTLRSLHMGEWRQKYLPNDYECIVDFPVRWKLTVEYNGNQAPIHYEGEGIFPYNFESLAKLLGAEVD